MSPRHHQVAFSSADFAMRSAGVSSEEEAAGVAASLVATRAQVGELCSPAPATAP